MDNNVEELSQKKDALYKELTDLILQGLDNGTIDPEDAENSSLFILERLDNISSPTLLLAFTEELANRWPFFKPLSIAQKEESSSNEDLQKVTSLTAEISNLSQSNQQ